jgi:hypothetical protein
MSQARWANTSGHLRPPGQGVPVARLFMAEPLASSAGHSRGITGVPMLE